MRKREDGGQVAALVAEGHSDAEIAALLGRTFGAVQKQRQRLGIACAVVRTRWDRERVAHVLHLLREGRKLPEIDALSRLAPGTTAQRLRRLGVSTLGVDTQEIARRLEEADRRERVGVGEGASRRRWREWSSDEDSALEVLAGQGVSDLEVGRLLARPRGAVAGRRRQLGISLGDPGDPWTPGEDARLITLKGEGVTAEGIGGILGRTSRAVQVRVGRLGQSTPTWWTTEEDATLRLEWERGTDIKAIAQMLGRTRSVARDLHRTPGAVGYRRRALGLASRQEHVAWSAEDDATLKREWERGTDTRTIAQVLGRTRVAVVQAVLHRREGLGLALRCRRWSAEDDATLKREWERGTNTKTIAQVLGRTRNAVDNRRWAFGLASRRGYVAWSAEDDATLKREWERGTDTRTIAQMLGRTRIAVILAVAHRRERLGLALRCRRWSTEDDATLRLERHRGTDTKTIAQMLGRTQGAVSQAVEGAGLVVRVPGGEVDAEA